jgi:hypothetical protein
MFSRDYIWGGLELSKCLELAVGDAECPLSHCIPVQNVSSPYYTYNVQVTMK